MNIFTRTLVVMDELMSLVFETVLTCVEKSKITVLPLYLLDTSEYRIYLWEMMLSHSNTTL